MNRSTYLKYLSAAAALYLGTSAAIAGVSTGGNNEQEFNLKNGALIAIAGGSGAKAINEVNTNDGNVSFGANNKQTATITNGALIAIAGGSNAQAHNRVNSNKGN